MRKLLSFLLLLWGCFGAAQVAFSTNSGQVTFFSPSPIEDIFAVNDKVSTEILPNGEITTNLMVGEFKFKKKLMQEHFNEKYIETETYPEAYFTGNIDSFNPDRITEERITFPLTGELTLHGVTRPIATALNIRREGDTLSLETTFTVRTQDFKIRVPRFLFKKIAEEIQVQVSARLNKN